MTAVLNLVLMLGMLVVVPLGLGLVGDLPGWLPRLWVAAAIPAAASLWLPRGLLAGALASGYAVVCVLLAVVGLTRHRPVTPRGLALLTALLAPAVAGTSLVAERYGVKLLGFAPRVLALTVAHFHYAGFAAALIAALLASSRSGSTRDSQAAALSVPAGIGLVFVGFFSTPAVELAGAVVLTAGMWLVSGQIWRERRATDGVTRGLFAVASVVPVATMALAVEWALGRATGLPHLSLDWMVATHGVANAVGFALCCVLALRQATGRRHTTADRSPQWTS
jgi:hypothetical protein